MASWLDAAFTPDSTKVAAEQQAAQNDAVLELFAKTAAAQNVDLTKMSQAQISAEFDAFCTKLAEAEKEEEEEAKRKKREEAAAAEHNEKKAEFAKVAEWQQGGATMADSFTQRLADNGVLELLQKFASGNAIETTGTAAAGEKAKGLFGRAKDSVSGAASAVKGKVGDAARYVASAVKNNPGRAAGIAGGAAALAGGAALAHHHFSHKGGSPEGEKSASAIDQLAFDEVGAIAERFGLPVEDTLSKVAAALQLGDIGESKKVAMVEGLPEAVTVRAFEMLEGARFAVDWDSVAKIVEGQ